MTRRTSYSTRFGWQIAAALLLVLVVLSLSIPVVRASLSAWLGLSVAPSNQMPAASVTLVAAASPTPANTAPAAAPLPTLTETNATPTESVSLTPVQPVESSEKLPGINQLSVQAGWDILVPNYLPDGYQFQSAYFDTNHQMVILTYLVTRPLPGSTDASLTESKTVTLLQAQKNDFVPMQIAPDTQVVDVEVNGQPAVYTVGAWDTEFVKDDQDPNGGKMVSTWRNDIPVKNLYFQVGNVNMVLVTEDETLNQHDLIDIAASISGS